MNHIQQAPLSYFHYLINLGGFEVERAKFYENINNWDEHKPDDFMIDKDRHIISYSAYDNGVFTPIHFYLDVNLNLQGRMREAASAMYVGLNAKSEKDQPMYKHRLRSELEAMLHTISCQPSLKEYSPLKNCILELLKSVKNQVTVTSEVISFKYKDTNPTRANGKLANLHSSLILRKLIDPSTSLWDLKAVFQAKLIKRQVKWTGLNWQLTLLITNMTEMECIVSKADIWVTAATCFLDSRGEPFTNLKLGQPKYPKGKEDKKQEVIAIAEAFKPD